MTDEKGRSPSIQFYFRQFSGDENVTTMDLDAVGAHILLMCAAGASPEQYRLAYNTDKIRRIIKSPTKEKFEQILSQLLEGAWKISEDGEWLIQDGMFRALKKQKQFSKLQSKRAKERWRAERDAKKMPEASRNDAKPMPSSSSTSTSTTTVINNSEPTFPASINLPECHIAWEGWKEYKRAEKNQRYKTIKTEEQALKNLAHLTPDRFVKAIDHSIGNQYSGIYEPNVRFPFDAKKSNAEKTADTVRKIIEQENTHEQN